MKSRTPEDRQYTRLNRKITLVTLICSVVPLLCTGWALNLYYSRFVYERTVDKFESQVAHHRQIIELFLSERSSAIQLLAETHTVAQVSSNRYLQRLFETLNRQYGDSFTDLGVIDDYGNHLAYVGPYDLLDRNYAGEFWFKEVMEKGVYISDMFLGFRKVPHFIIAIRHIEGDYSWILRATINTEIFRSLVEDVRIGQTGEVYLLNQEGLFQTNPRFEGSIMDPAPFAVGEPHDGIEVDLIDDDEEQIAAHVWLANPKWMLVVRQDYSEAFEAVEDINQVTLILLHLSALMILLVSFLTAKHLIKTLRKRDEEANSLNKQLLQTSKMASLGELAAGVAHEINNPIAIIMTERQILLDLVDENRLEPTFEAQLLKSLSQIKVEMHRCRRITHGLLAFARRTTAETLRVDLNAIIGEIIGLMEREARTSGVQISTKFTDDLHDVLIDPSLVQQVLVNLINNAIDSHEGREGEVQIETEIEEDESWIRIAVRDTGCGIEREHLDRIFEPFFTTKEVGKGTGLGLAICYSSVEQLGGQLSVTSAGVGKGAEFTIRLPYSKRQ